MALVYHATPSIFQTLRAGSWVSTSLAEACLHLLMKNTDAPSYQATFTHRLRGYVITLDCPAESLEEMIQMGETTNLVTRCDLSIPGPESFVPLEKAVASLPENEQWVFHAEDIIDLKPFLQTTGT